MPWSGVALAAAATALAAPARVVQTGLHGGHDDGRGRDRAHLLRAAKATVHVAGKTLTFKGGSCERTSKYLSLQIGTVVLGQTKKKKPDYFGINVGAYPGSTTKAATKDGKYVGAVTRRRLPRQGVSAPRRHGQDHAGRRTDTRVVHRVDPVRLRVGQRHVQLLTAQWRAHASGSAASAATSSGSSPRASSPTLTCSSTERRLARTAIHTSRSRSALPA